MRQDLNKTLLYYSGVDATTTKLNLPITRNRLNKRLRVFFSPVGG
jgi:hypothetical protein